MPKLKTHRGAAKRFVLKASGKIKFRRGYRNHILTKYSTKRKRQLRVGDNLLDASNVPMIRRLLTGS